jgi:hypothetical protein
VIPVGEATELGEEGMRLWVLALLRQIVTQFPPIRSLPSHNASGSRFDSETRVGAV